MTEFMQKLIRLCTHLLSADPVSIANTFRDILLTRFHSDFFKGGISLEMEPRPNKKNKCVYCYTPGKRRVGRMENFFFFIFIFFLTWITHMHIMALNMRRPHTFCVYIGLRTLKLLLPCGIIAFYQIWGCFVNIFWGKIRGKILQSGGFGEDRSGYSKHNFFFFFFFFFPDDHWSCTAHLSAEDMLKSAVIEEKKLKHRPWAGADNLFGPKFLCQQEGLITIRLLVRYARPPHPWGILQTYPILKINYCHMECKMFALCIWWSKCVTACYICYPHWNR